MRSRPWAWLRLKIVGLVTRPPIGYYRVDLPSTDGGQTQPYWMKPFYANRLSGRFYAEK